MNFLEALELAKNGKKIRLKNWCNQNFYLLLKQDSLCHQYGDEERLYTKLNATEYLSLDWEEWQEKLELHTFEEALKALLKNGKRIKQCSNDHIYSIDNNNQLFVTTVGNITQKQHILPISGIPTSCIMANDWTILENEED